MYIILDRQQKNVHGLNLNTQYIHFRKLPDQKEDVHIIDCSCDDKVLCLANPMYCKHFFTN